MTALTLDSYDLKLLRALQENARISHVALSEIVNLSPSQCTRRLQRLEEAGLIERYTALLDKEKVGLGVQAVVMVTLDRHGDSTASFHAAVQNWPEVLECWSITGGADYELRVVARDLKAFSDFLMHRLTVQPHVAHVHSYILLTRIKETTVLPLSRQP